MPAPRWQIGSASRGAAMRDYPEILRRCRAWVQQAAHEGWLDADAPRRFDSIESGVAADLFAAPAARPLVVALFGGTGVGKSSLLNRLAGAPLARVGVQRPTSREVTLYVHEAVELGTLPQDLLAQVGVQRHRIDARRGVCWIDAPDIDSTEESNRRLALSWLPYVDLVIYVVSPERYRDDVGWRVLQQRGQRHGWMFVLNHWDEGDPRQMDDLAAILRKAGFENPLLFRTSCTPRTQSPPDDFEKIEHSLAALLAEHGLRELERIGCAARLAEIGAALNDALTGLGSDATWAERKRAWMQRWQQTASAIHDGLAWPIAAASARFGIRQSGALERILSAVRASDARPAPAEPIDDVVALTRPLWDDWALAKLNEFVDAAEIDLRRAAACPDRTRRAFGNVVDQSAEIVLRRVQESLRNSLAKPGSRLRRSARSASAFLTIVLPAIALVFWIAPRVVLSFHEAGTTGRYLDANFAIHSGMLLLLAFGIPFACDRLLRPSVERAARDGMTAGLDRGLDQLGDHYAAAIDETAAKLADVRRQGQILLAEIAQWQRPHKSPVGKTVERILMTPHAAAPA
jgi:hypothetical protein